MDAIDTNNLKVFELMARNNEYFTVNVDENYITIFIKKSESTIEIKTKNIAKVNVHSPYTISIFTHAYGYLFISLITGYHSVSF